MCRFYTMNTQAERVPLCYANAKFSSAEGSRTLACFGENNDDDFYDDEDDNEKEWCD